MNKEAFQKLLHNPTNIAPEALESLEELVRLFPYCSLAHVLIAKSHYDQATMLASQKLRKAAAYSVNRSKLKKIISGEWPQLPNLAPALPDRPVLPDAPFIVEAKIEVKEREPEIDSVSIHQEEVEEELVIDTPTEVLFEKLLAPLQLPPQSSPEQDEEPEEPPLHVGHLNEDDQAIEQFSRRTKKHIQREIIESFIRSEPRISALNFAEKDSYTNRDLSEKSTQPVQVISETMANIYVKQRKYDKAIEMFEKLILKFPEKKAYFAERIQDLKKQ